MFMKLRYIIKKSDNYINVKDVLKNEFGISDRLLLKLKNNKKIFLNNFPVYVKNNVKYNDIIEVYIDFKEDNSNIIPNKMDLKIIYEDDYLLVIDKPPKTAIHPSCRHYSTSLSNGVKFYFDTIGLKKKIRPVNRLDKDTSGIVIFSKNEYIQECLIKQMKDNRFIKEYLAFLEGCLEANSGMINAPILRKENSIIERCISSDGAPAITYYDVLDKNKNFSFVHFTLKTGRTHQIRVHCRHIGHSIIGDTLYGKSSNLINRQALHSWKISFVHPITNKKLEIKSNLPKDMMALIDLFNHTYTE